MAWSRILRFARERRVPIVVTDDEGESPMVLVSLEELEAILDGNDRSTPPPDLEPIMYPSVKKEETQAPNFLDSHYFTTQDSVDSDEVPFFEQEETSPVEAQITESASELDTEQADVFLDPQTFLTELTPSIAPDVSEEKDSSDPHVEEGEGVRDQEIVTPEPLQAPSAETKPADLRREALSLEEQFYLDHG